MPDYRQQKLCRQWHHVGPTHNLLYLTSESPIFDLSSIYIKGIHVRGTKFAKFWTNSRNLIPAKYAMSIYAKINSRKISRNCDFRKDLYLY